MLRKTRPHLETLLTILKRLYTNATLMIYEPIIGSTSVHCTNILYLIHHTLFYLGLLLLTETERPVLEYVPSVVFVVPTNLRFAGVFNDSYSILAFPTRSPLRAVN